MNRPTLPRPTRNRLIALAASALLAACGGGDAPADGVTAAESSSNVPSARILAASGDSSSARASRTANPGTTSPIPRVESDTGSKQVATTVTVRAYGSLAGNVGPVMAVRVDGVVVGTVEVRAIAPQDYVFSAAGLIAGSRVDVVFTNDDLIHGQDRNLFVAYVTDGTSFVAPSEPGVVYDAGGGEGAFDGKNTLPGQEAMWFSGALRITWPPADRFAATTRDLESSRFLQQATFGPTISDLQRLRTRSFAQWIDAQLAAPVNTDYFVSYIQSKYNMGTAYRPFGGSKYDPDWVGQRFWTGAASGSDQLRRRMAFALHKIFVASQADANLYHQARAFAAYLDALHRGAFGNFRALLEDVALSPAMGIYLSHLRNMKEDAATNRLPDENFARELMQLFTIGLHELNLDGTDRLDASGRPIETYGNADVMALAKVFTGWSWGYDDRLLTDFNFRWGTPNPKSVGVNRVDIRRMKPYPGMASIAERRLFAGKPNELVILPNTSPSDSVGMALDTLFNHPNVGPFIGRQLIQQFVTSNPSPGYVARVAQVFANNGSGVRGDLGAVLRAVLLDTEARVVSTSNSGKVREPILRVTHWMRSFDAQSASGEFQITQELTGLGQRPNLMPSVFSFFRPGYVPAGGALALAGLGSPEMQIIDESSTAAWANSMELMLREGIGWSGGSRDVTVSLAAHGEMVATAPAALLANLDLMLFAGRMSSELRKSVMDAMQGVPDWAPSRNLARARVAIYVAMTSPEYLVQQ